MTDVRRVDHVQLPMPLGGSGRARAFYEGLLGWRELRDPLLNRPGTLRYSLGGQRLDLSEGNFVRVAPQAHLALAMGGLEPLMARLRAARWPIDVDTLAKGLRFYVEDPFGNRLELFEAHSQESSFDVSQIRFAV